VPALVRIAQAVPETAALFTVVWIAAGISKPVAASKSSGTPDTVIGRPSVSTPLLGGFWMNSLFVTGSITYSVVTPPTSPWEKLLV